MEQNWHTVSLEKQLLRKKLKIFRESFSEHFRLKASKIIANTLCTYLNQVCVAAYYPVNTEVNVITSLKYITEKILSLPCLENEQIVFRRWYVDQNLVINKWSIPEPDPEYSEVIIPEIIIVPMIGFDRNLNRLGYGHGYYDKVLKNHPSSISIGLAFSFQEVDAIPTAPHDQKLNIIITEKEVIN